MVNPLWIENGGSVREDASRGAADPGVILRQSRPFEVSHALPRLASQPCTQTDGLRGRLGIAMP